ncbi:hypothetical protein Q8A73_003697 [Channa argus]|nr:hypothetical protein Q8A73_003697 [Channa argus]
MEPRHGIMKAFPKVKRARVQLGKDEPQLKKKPDECVVTGNTFNGVTVYILPAGIGNARCQIFQRQIHQNGGHTESALCPSVTHVVVDDNMDSDRALRLLKADRMPSGVQLVKCTWLSLCISEKELLDVTSYSLVSPERASKTQHKNITEELLNVEPAAEALEPVFHQNKQEETINMAVSDNKEEQVEDDGVSQRDLEALITGHHPEEETPGPSLDHGPDLIAQKAVSGKWVCAQSSMSKSHNFNKHITDKLEVLAKAYTHQGDKWRALSYSKAVNALKSYHKPISSYQEACQIPGIGKSMADKIDEIMESGHLRKLDHIGDAVPVLELFTNIWGAGAKTAQLWYQQGFRTLEDIRTKAHLSSTQKIGLKYYQDFLDRMPREEAAAIEKVVKDAVQAVDPGLVAMACGSFRREKATCGDVDVLITHPDGQSHKGLDAHHVAHMDRVEVTTPHAVHPGGAAVLGKRLGGMRGLCSALKMGLFLHAVGSVTPTESAADRSLLHCEGVNNQSYICESGHCCGESQCCSYYYELWWFWLVWAIIFILSCCCVCHHRRTKHRLQQQQRQHEINLIAYREAHSYPSVPFYFRFLPNYLLPDYEEVVNRPPTPPPPYSALHPGPSSVGSSPLASEQQEGHCQTIQPTPVPPVSDSLCSRPSREEPHPPTLDFRPKPDNKPIQTAQDSGMILLSGGLSEEGLTSQEKGSRSGGESCKDPLLKDLSDSPAEDKDRLPSGRRRRFTGDSGIEVCVCGTHGSSGGIGASRTGHEERELRELDSLLGCKGGDEEEGEEEVGEFCDSCGHRAFLSMEEEQVLGELERRAARGPSGPPQTGHPIGSGSLHPPVCLLLHTISEQDGLHHSPSTEPQG